MRRRPRAEELFVLNGLVSFGGAAIWTAWRSELLLEHFYFTTLLALTHLFTLGFLTSLMMGVLYRLGPMLLGQQAASRRVAAWQFGLFFVGSWGMIAHFGIGEWKGMSWSAILVWGASLLQLVNFRGVFRRGKENWIRAYVGFAMICLFLAASLGVVLALGKGYDFRLAFLARDYLSNVFAHAHLAGAGWVTAMILGFELALVPTTRGEARWLRVRFALLAVGTIGIAVAFLVERNTFVFALLLTAAFLWHAAGPLRSFVRGKAREWELAPLLLLVSAGFVGALLSLGWPDAADPMRARVQLAYGVLAVIGFMSFTVVVVAFKLFPMWVWKERFQDEFGKRPVPGMKELASPALGRAANLAVLLGAPGTVLGILLGSEVLLDAATPVLAAGVALFLANVARVLRWALLDIEFHPSEADEKKFAELFRRSQYNRNRGSK